jgi:hypothetical protein
MATRKWTEAVIGFDAREVFVDPAKAWTPERRRDHLLRSDVAKPLSVDALVWPSVFHELPVYGSGGIVADLWDDLGEMRAALAERRPPAHRIVAVSWLTDDPGAKGGPRHGTREATPRDLGAEWELLGYDVADGGCLSGLSNCAYSPFERAELAPAWGPKLNAAGLLADAEDAFLYRAVTDRRVSEHAPFFVWALRALRP